MDTGFDSEPLRRLGVRWPGALRLASRVGVTAALAVLLSIGSKAGSVQSPVNEMCPVMTEEPASPDFTTVYQGQLIGFCCDKCVAKFEANPGRYSAELVAFHDGASRAAGTNQPTDASRQTAHPSTLSPSAEHDHAHADAAGASVSAFFGHGDHEHPDDEPAGGRHTHDHGVQEGFLAKLINWLGRFHPSMVHFPIAMLLGAALAEVLRMVTGRAFFLNAGRFCLWVGGVAAVVAAVLGWFFGGFHLVDDSWILTTHRWLGTTTAVLSVGLLVVGERTFRRADASWAGYRTMLFLGAGLVGATGFFGGALIYGLAHNVWR